MITIRTFRIVLILLAASGVLSLVCGIGLRHTLPSEILAYKHTVALAHRGGGGHLNLWRGVGSLLLLLAYFVDIIGLYLLRPFARPLFVVLLALCFLFLMFSGIRIQPRAAAWFDDVSSLLSGVVLSLLYWSPIRDRFITRHAVA